VAYVTFPEGNLWRCRIDGSEKLQLTSAPLWVGPVRWSPDERQLVFVGSEPGTKPRLFVVSAEGGTLRELKAGRYDAEYPGWSADGDSIFFNDRYDAEISTFGSVEIHSGEAKAIPGMENLVGATVSPDGKFVAATELTGDRLLLYDLFAHKKVLQLDHTAVGFLEWSLDSRFVYFDNGFTPNPAVYRMALADHKVEQVANLKEFRRVVNNWYSWFGVTPEGDVLLMHDTGSQEVYALDLEIP
jgi:hypothetical protein